MSASLIVSLKYSVLPSRKLVEIFMKYSKAKNTKRTSNKYASKIPSDPNDIPTKRNPVGSFIARPMKSIIIVHLI